MSQVDGYRTSIFNECRLDTLESGGTLHPTEPWLSAYGAICNGRAIFKASKGYIDSGPNYMAAGDQVCLLESVRTPFILRRMLNSHQYKLVGETYVHGIMQGQAFILLWWDRTVISPCGGGRYLYARELHRAEGVDSSRGIKQALLRISL